MMSSVSLSHSKNAGVWGRRTDTDMNVWNGEHGDECVQLMADQGQSTSREDRVFSTNGAGGI